MQFFIRTGFGRETCRDHIRQVQSLLCLRFEWRLLAWDFLWLGSDHCANEWHQLLRQKYDDSRDNKLQS